jgi:hypothetical protein
MAKQRKRATTTAQSMFRVVGESAGAALGSTISGAFASVKHETHLLMDDVEVRVMDFRGRFVKKMFASMLIGIGALFIFVALLMYLVDIFELSWATAVLIVGVLLLIVAFIIQATSARRHGK